MKNLLAWTFIVPGTLALGYFIESTTKRKVLHLMAGRQAYTPQQFGEHFFPAEQAEVAARFRTLLSAHVPVDMTRLDPDDRLVQDLGIGQRDGLDTVALIQDAEREFGTSIPDVEAEKLLTVRQFVSYLARTRETA